MECTSLLVRFRRLRLQIGVPRPWLSMVQCVLRSFYLVEYVFAAFTSGTVRPLLVRFSTPTFANRYPSSCLSSGLSLLQCVLHSFYLDVYDFAAFTSRAVRPFEFLAKLLARDHRSTRQGAVTHAALAWGGSLPALCLQFRVFHKGVSFLLMYLCRLPASFGLDTEVSQA
jgi:hypothetical protein